MVDLGSVYNRVSEGDCVGFRFHLSAYLASLALDYSVNTWQNVEISVTA